MGDVLTPGTKVRPKSWVLGWAPKERKDIGLLNGEQAPTNGKTYTVRDVRTLNGAEEITLEEIVNPVLDYEIDGMNELHFRANDFDMVQ